MTDADVTVAPAWKPLALMFAVSGTLHFATPGPFEAIVPRWLPARVGTAKTLVRVSGAAELACAAGLARSRTRRPAGLASAVLLAAVYPANVDMAARALRSSRASGWWRAALVARLPLQVPLIVRALRVGGAL